MNERPRRFFYPINENDQVVFRQDSNNKKPFLRKNNREVVVLDVIGLSIARGKRQVKWLRTWFSEEPRLRANVCFGYSMFPEAFCSRPPYHC